MTEAFFTLHRDLPREGPGLAEDVAWAAHVTGLPADGRVLDAGCGPGGDLAALGRAVPRGRVLGLDRVPHFVAAARERFAGDPVIRAEEGDMAAAPGGPYDLIWSAGAVYFLGISGALAAWRRVLTPSGAVVFSHPTLWEDTPGARAFWGADPCGTEAAHRAEIAAAGWGVIATRRVTEACWMAYYGPLLARCDALEEGADPALAEVIAEARAEVASWRQVRDQTGYMLYAVRPT